MVAGMGALHLFRYMHIKLLRTAFYFSLSWKLTGHLFTILSNSSGSFANNATTSRALPPPPPPSANAASDSDAEVEPSVRISCGGDHHDTSFPTHMDLGPWSDDESLDGPIEAKDFTVSIEKVKDVSSAIHILCLIRCNIAWIIDILDNII